MLANEITVAAGCGGASISGFTFGVANFSGSTVTAYVLLSFYSNNGPSGGPGAFLGGYSEEITNLTTATRTTFTASGLTGFNVHDFCMLEGFPRISECNDRQLDRLAAKMGAVLRRRKGL